MQKGGASEQIDSVNDYNVSETKLKEEKKTK